MILYTSERIYLSTATAHGTDAGDQAVRCLQLPVQVRWIPLSPTPDFPVIHAQPSSSACPAVLERMHVSYMGCHSNHPSSVDLFLPLCRVYWWRIPCVPCHIPGGTMVPRSPGGTADPAMKPLTHIMPCCSSKARRGDPSGSRRAAWPYDRTASTCERPVSCLCLHVPCPGGRSEARGTKVRWALAKHRRV